MSPRFRRPTRAKSSRCWSSRGADPPRRGEWAHFDRFGIAGKCRADDDLKEQEERAQLQLGALRSPGKAAQIRNVPLAEALGWAVYGEWGKPYHVPAVGMFIGIGTDPRNLLARFTQLAREGKLTTWGKRDDPGFFEKIPQSHWQDNELTIADVFGSVVASGDNPYRDLMLNRAQVQREWPHEG